MFSFVFGSVLFRRLTGFYAVHPSSLAGHPHPNPPLQGAHRLVGRCRSAGTAHAPRNPRFTPRAGEGAKPNRLFFIGLLATLIATNAFAINAVNPTGVNVRSNAPNTVFITFQGLEPNERAVEALWCGTVQPGVGAGSVTTSDPCVPNTLFGRLPLNFDRSRATLGVGQKNGIEIILRDRWRTKGCESLTRPAGSRRPLA